VNCAGKASSTGLICAAIYVVDLSNKDTANRWTTVCCAGTSNLVISSSGTDGNWCWSLRAHAVRRLVDGWLAEICGGGARCRSDNCGLH